jgi:hypothetical protein
MEKSVDSVHASWTTASGRSTVDPHGGADRETAGERPGRRSDLPVLTDGGWEGEGWYGGLTTGFTGARERWSGRATRVNWWRRRSSVGVCSDVGEEERGMVSGAGCSEVEVPLS